MRYLLIILIYLFASTASAQIPEKWFSAALARSDSFSIALSEAQNAKIRLQRLKSDPLATKPLLLEASTTLELAEARVIAARLDVRRSVLQDTFAWNSAANALDLASARANLADANARAANARFKTGAITNSELNRAEADLRAAQSEVTSARSEWLAASEVLRSRLGFAADASLPNVATPRPQKIILEKSIENNLRVVETRGSLARAKLDLTIKDNEFTAPVEINEARRSVANAERNLADARNVVKTGLVNRWETYQSTVNAITARERGVQLARDELKTQSDRFSRGLVSQLVVLQAKVNLAQQLALFEEARQRFSLAVLELAVLVNVDVWL